jgi:hypothetical protein
VANITQIHLAPRQIPEKKYTFQDLGIQKPASASSDIAGTAPFPLYSPQSIPLIRKALLNPRYLDSTAVIFGPKTLIIRNTAAHSPFFRRLCNDPFVIERLSHAAGVVLEPVMETMEVSFAYFTLIFGTISDILCDSSVTQTFRSILASTLGSHGRKPWAELHIT